MHSGKNIWSCQINELSITDIDTTELFDESQKGKVFFVAYLTKTTGIKNLSGDFFNMTYNHLEHEFKPSITFSQAFKMLS
jgi:hypothetical protein